MKKYIQLTSASFLVLLSFVLMNKVVSANPLTPKHEMRAAWISTVSNIDLKAGMDEFEFREWAETEIKNLEKKNFNTVIFQVKPTADALYPSELAPWSRFITGEGQGVDPGYDPLQIMLDTAHKYGLELHAWINPYRVTMVSHGLDTLSPDNIAVKQPDWVVKFGNQHYLDPGIPGVQDYLIETVKELIENYDIDAVHMDDYFYPGIDFDDEDTFAEYGGDFTDIGDWRRNNVNELVENINLSIKEIKPLVQFGISPSGIWRNKANDPRGSDTNGQAHYDVLFADSQHWIQSGFVDYITPQIYWSRKLAVASYTTLIDWWSKAVDPYPVNLYIGMADYKVNNNFDTEWENPRELPEQIIDNRANGKIQGQMHFTLRDIKNNAIGYGDIIEEEIYHHKSLTPTFSWIDSSIPHKPENVTLQKQSNGLEIMIDPSTEGVKTRKFVIYRFDDEDSIDYTNPSNIVGVRFNEQGATFLDTKANPDESYVYGVTAISQTGIESEGAFEQEWISLDKSSLESLVKQAKDKKKEDYTEASWKNLVHALAHAEKVLADEDATQEDLDNALAKLTEALEQLTEVPIDSTELELLMKEAKEKQEENYTEESWKVLMHVLAHAENTLVDKDATQEDLDNALNQLAEALAQLEKASIDTTEFELLMKEAQDKKKEDYTEESWKNLMHALEDAENVLADEDATQEDLDHALNELREALAQLEKAPIDITELESLVKQAKDKKKEDYTEASWKNLMHALAHAENTLVDKDATQENVDESTEQLKNAINTLQEIPKLDTEKLESLISQGNQKEEENYTQESWKIFTETLENARELLEDDSAHQEDINLMVAQLTEAMDQLVLKPSLGEQLPKTSTNTFNMMLVGIIFLMLGSLLFFLNKRRVYDRV